MSPQSPENQPTPLIFRQLILSFGVTYAAVPLYRAFCSATGFAGTPMTDPTRFSPDRLYTTPETESRKRITVHFQATSSDTLPWTFEPLQKHVKVLPGETALAFYRAKNTGDKDLIGIATYNMTPEKVSASCGTFAPVRRPVSARRRAGVFRAVHAEQGRVLSTRAVFKTTSRGVVGDCSPVLHDLSLDLLSLAGGLAPFRHGCLQHRLSSGERRKLGPARPMTCWFSSPAAIPSERLAAAPLLCQRACVRCQFRG